MISRRNFLKNSFYAGGAVMLPAGLMSGKAFGQTALLDPLTQTKFTNRLPVPPVLNMTRGGSFNIPITQIQKSFGLRNGNRVLQSTAWAYNGSSPGPTIIARRGRPVNVAWSNRLVNGRGQPLRHLFDIDSTLHWADPLKAGKVDGPYVGPVPLVTHLHGAHVGPSADGHPEGWATPGNAITGRAFSQNFYYDNDQEAATLWYHDHTLGISRLNVGAGLVGSYWLRDENEDLLIATNKLPRGPYEMPLMIQDAQFTATGALFYPTAPEDPSHPIVSWLPEFFGDTILVNGSAWPVLRVEPRQYRFRMVNASDSRYYSMTMSSGQQFFQIGSDQGMLNAPVALSRLTLGPGERADIVIDFRGQVGKTIIIGNDANAPFPGGDPIDPDTVGQIMAFRVNLELNDDFPRTTLPANLRPVHGPVKALNATPSAPVRKLLLFEGMDGYGRLLGMLGTAAGGGMMWADPATETPRLNDTEIWEIYNASADAHPIHLHLVNYRVINREGFTADVNETTGALSNVVLDGVKRPPEANEAGMKDTLSMFPGEVTRIIAKFDRPGEYVWHCHILSHEDNEMMRPLIVS
jgi:spore coat protein A, manganese oxidase